MDSSDRLLVPCFFAALAINALGIWVVSSSEVFDPNRRPPPPKVAPERQVVQLYKRPTPPPPTPKPVEATPTPAPTPTAPKPTPTPAPDKPTPRPVDKPTLQTRLQATTQKPAAHTDKPPLPQANLSLGATSTRGEGPTVNRNETRGDVRTGTVTTTTEHVEGPKATRPAAPPSTPPPTPAPIVVTTPPPTPVPPPPTPVPPPPPTPVPPKRVTVSVTSEPATPLGSWQDVVGSVSIPDGDDASRLKKSATVEIETDVEGQVKSVRMQSSSGIGAVDDQIKRACRKMRFKPPTQDGTPLPARFTHTFTLS